MRTEREIKGMIQDLREKYDLLDPGHSQKESTLSQITALEWVLGGNWTARPFGK